MCDILGIMEYDTQRLIEQQIGRSFEEAWQTIDAEAGRAEHQAKTKDKNVRYSARKYRESLGRVLYWFHHGTRAMGTTDGEWFALGKLAHDFAKRRIMKPEILAVFNIKFDEADSKSVG
jgi:hypothetical protein